MPLDNIFLLQKYHYFTGIFVLCRLPYSSAGTLRELMSLFLFLALLLELADGLLGRWSLHIMLLSLSSLFSWGVWLPLHRVRDSCTLRAISAITSLVSGLCRLLRLAQLVSLHLTVSHMRPHTAASTAIIYFFMGFVDLYTVCRSVSLQIIHNKICR